MKLIFAGTSDFAVPILQALLAGGYRPDLVLTQPDRPSGRGLKLQASAIKMLALAEKIPIFQPESLRDTASQSYLAQFHPQVMIVVAYGLLLPEAVLNMPQYGCINVHASLLPRWRGASPIQQAILAGDQQTGVTIMKMDKGMDTGAIYCQQSCAILPNDTAATLQSRLAALGAETLVAFLPELLAGKACATPQDATKATYAKKILKTDAKINWQASAASIEHLIRAYNPWPVAFSEMDGQPIRIWQAHMTATKSNVPPGTIISTGKTGITVACAQDALTVEKLQLPGSRIISVADALNAKAALFAIGKQFS